MTIKQLLISARQTAMNIETEKELKARLDKLIELRSRAGGQQSVNGQDIESIKTQSATLSDKLDDDINRMISLIEHVRQMIGTLESPDQKTVLIMRYLLCMNWSTIADKMNYSKRTVARIYNTAIRCLEKNGTQWHTDL